jgi:transposase
MKKIVKQVAGIDVAQKELVICLGRMYDDWRPELYASKTFANTAKGHVALLTWVKKQTDKQVPTRYVMEATGVYHEAFAYFLDEQDKEVSIIVPNKISNYMRTLDVKTVTDKTSSEAITRFGLERALDRWKKPKEIYRNSRDITRERNQLIQERTIVKNQLHAENAGAYPNKNSIKRLKERLKLFNKQLLEIKKEIEELIATDEEVKENIDLLCSMPGIGTLTAVTIMAETNGFELIRNKRQLASYAGFDVKEKQSGTSVKGKARISKKGNRYLRKAMHLPALTAIKHDDHFKSIYARIVAKHGVKMKAAVAVQRRLLEMTYTLYKTKTTYDKNHLSGRSLK